MRRISMLLAGLFIGVVILSALIVVMGREYIAGEEQIITAFSHDISVPYHISSTPLILRNIVCYEGVFIEDGSQEEVSGIFGAVIENTGAHYVQTGEIWVLSDNELLVFKFSLLPPGSCTLVLEKNRKTVYNMFIHCFLHKEKYNVCKTDRKRNFLRKDHRISHGKRSRAIRCP